MYRCYVKLFKLYWVKVHQLNLRTSPYVLDDGGAASSGRPRFDSSSGLLYVEFGELHVAVRGLSSFPHCESMVCVCVCVSHNELAVIKKFHCGFSFIVDHSSGW